MKKSRFSASQVIKDLNENKEPQKQWVLQHHLFGLGNFINLTPTLQVLFEIFGSKIPVFFESQYVKDFFEDCHFIEILSVRPSSNPILSSSIINKKVPDWIYIYQYAKHHLGYDLPARLKYHTYVPHRKKAVILKSAVLINGCANPSLFEVKSVDSLTWRRIVLKLKELGYKVTIVGGGDDYRFWKRSFLLQDIDNCVFDNPSMVKEEIQVGAKVIGNDTGLVHLAGALKKETFVLWKDTNFMKNISPNPYATYSFRGNWIVDFKEWIN